MNERERLTLEAARRLLCSRLRQHIVRKSQEVERRRGKDESWDMFLDAEKSIEAASEAAWISTLKLWGSTDPDSPDRPKLEALARLGLTSAIKLASHFILERQVDYEHENVQDWVREFIASFDPSTLLGGQQPCASAI